MAVTSNMGLAAPVATDYVNVGDLTGNFQKIDKAMWPIGSVYMNVNDSRNPNLILGFGEWAQLQGVFLVGAGGGFAMSDTGGRSDMGMHPNGSEPGAVDVVKNAGLIKSDTAESASVSGDGGRTVALGGAQFGGRILVSDEDYDDEFLPPYKAVAMWYRVA